MNHSLCSLTRALATVSLGVMLSSACTAQSAPGSAPAVAQPQAAITINAPPTPTPTVTPLPPTATPVPLAARVNDQVISLEQFNSELAHYLDNAGPKDPQAAEAQQIVLSQLIQRMLIMQEAAQQNIVVSDQQVQEEITIARARAGGDEAYVTWLAASRISPEEAQDRVRIALLTAAVRDRVLASVPREAEHVRAFHILVGTEIEAQQMLDRLDAGAVFGPLATRFSIDDGTRADEGDLGWFPYDAGALIWPEVEDVAFQLQPGETSGIIASPAGFHIVRVVAREMQQLSEAMFTALRNRALEKWMSDLMKQARIDRYL
jgi:parvulin-like peptidyl-prolyl isomerase